MGKSKWFLFLALFLVVGFVFAVPAMAKVKGLTLSRGAHAQEVVAEKFGMVFERPFYFPVKFVGVKGRGIERNLIVRDLKSIESGETIYTFPEPIPMPKSGDAVDISGTINLNGETFYLPHALVLVN